LAFLGWAATQILSRGSLGSSCHNPGVLPAVVTGLLAQASGRGHHYDPGLCIARDAGARGQELSSEGGRLTRPHHTRIFI